MDFEFEANWRTHLTRISEGYGQQLDLQGVLFLIGVQELGQGPRKFSKQEKLNLMHIAVCHLLSAYGYYNFIGRDPEGWPHFEKVKSLPFLKDREQEQLIKEAIMDYFIEE